MFADNYGKFSILPLATTLFGLAVSQDKRITFTDRWFLTNRNVYPHIQMYIHTTRTHQLHAISLLRFFFSRSLHFINGKWCLRCFYCWHSSNMHQLSGVCVTEYFYTNSLAQSISRASRFESELHTKKNHDITRISNYNVKGRMETKILYTPKYHWLISRWENSRWYNSNKRNGMWIYRGIFF